MLEDEGTYIAAEQPLVWFHVIAMVAKPWNVSPSKKHWRKQVIAGMTRFQPSAGPLDIARHSTMQCCKAELKRPNRPRFLIHEFSEMRQGLVPYVNGVFYTGGAEEFWGPLGLRGRW